MFLHGALGGKGSEIEHLTLIGCTGGIDDPEDRAARVQSDERLANVIENEGLEAFLDQWLNMPMFRGLGPDALARRERLVNRPEGIAASLRNCGTGTQKPLWGQLHRLDMPVSVLVGTQDEKFGALASRLVHSIGTNALKATVMGGHAVHLQSPTEVHALLRAGM